MSGFFIAKKRIFSAFYKVVDNFYVLTYNETMPKKQRLQDKKEYFEEQNIYTHSKPLDEDHPYDNLHEADFVAQKSNKATRRKHFKEHAFGIKDEDAITKRQNIFKQVLTVVFIIFVVGVLAYTAYTDFFADGRDFPSLDDFKTLLETSWLYLLLALVSLVLHYCFKGLKLSFTCKALTKKFHLKTCMETAIIGNYYNTVTPLASGGQSFEIHHMSKHGIDGGVAFSAPIAAFFFNQLGFVILSTTALILFELNAFQLPIDIYSIFPSTITILAIIGIVCCTLMPLLVVVFCLTPKLGALLVKFGIKILAKLKLVKNAEITTQKTIKSIVHNAECLRKIGKSPLAFFSCLLFSFCEHFATVSLTFFTLKAFGYQTWYNASGIYTPAPNILMWLQAAQITLILFASIAFIPTPGNSGAADLSFFMFFKSGLKAGLAFPATIVWRLLSFYGYIIIGFTFATAKKRADNKRQKAREKDAVLSKKE